MLQEEHSGNGRPATIPPPAEHENTAPFHQGCPYFAVQDDPDTSLLFPSSMGCCHRAQPPTPVHLNHQETHCLTARHKGCPVYLQAGPLPSSLRGQIPTIAKPRRRAGFFMSILLLAALAALFAAWRGGLINLPTSPVEPTAPVAVAAPQVTATQELAVVNTAVPTPTLPATETAVPTPQSPTRHPAPYRHTHSHHCPARHLYSRATPAARHHQRGSHQLAHWPRHLLPCPANTQ